MSSKRHSVGDALLTIFAVSFWMMGIAVATTKGIVETFLSIFPPVAWVFSAQWILERFS